MPSEQWLALKMLVIVLSILFREALLNEMCQYSFLSPFQGGSSGKGTTLKDLSDADLVVFLTNLTSFQENFEHRVRFIKEIRRQLEAYQRQKTFEVEFEVLKQRKRKRRALSFVLRSPWFCQGVKFDVLPAFDALAKYSQSQGISAFVLCQGFFLSFFSWF